MELQQSASNRYRPTYSSNPGLSWIEQNRVLVLRLSVALAILILAGIIAAIWTSNRAAAGQSAFSSAMEIYDSPLKQPGVPAQPDITTYADAAARARAANPLFRQIAGKYGHFKAGMNARYFAGLTDLDMGNNAAAESDLQIASVSHDHNLAALAKMVLASLYLNTNRRAQATSLYQEVIDHPTTTVSANAARLALAESLEASNPQQARLLYAKIKDSAGQTVAGEIATQKLSGK